MVRSIFGQELGLYGHPRVDYPLYCTVTRVRLRSAWHLPRAWSYFRRVRRQMHGLDGLRRASFAIAGPRTFIILSVWDHEIALLDFATSITAHHDAVRSTLRRARQIQGGPEIWSTQWKIWSVSNNLNWNGSREWSPVLEAGALRSAHNQTGARALRDPEGGDK